MMEQFSDYTASALIQYFLQKDIAISYEDKGIKLRYKKETPISEEDRLVLATYKQRLLEYFQSEDSVPVQALQKGIYFHHVKAVEKNQYHVQVLLTINTDIDLEHVQRSLQETINQLPVLRTNYGIDAQGAIVQKTKPQALLNMLTEDLSHLDTRQQKEAIDAYLERDKAAKFNLEYDFLNRFALFQCADKQYQFVWSYHHIMLDGWSMSLVIQRFVALYNGIAVPQTQTTAVPQMQTLGDSFWQDYLAGFSTVNKLVVEQRHSLLPVGRSIKSHSQRLEATAQEIIQCARANHLPLNAFFQVAWYVTVAAFSQSDDVVFGTLCSTRDPHMSDDVGFFMNTLPVRFTANNHETVLDTLQRAHLNTAHLSNETQRTIADICEAIQFQGQELFSTLLLVDNFYGATSSSVLAVQPHELNIKTARTITPADISDVRVIESNNYPLTLVLHYDDTTISARIDYDPAVYSDAFIPACLQFFVNKLHWMVTHVQQPLSDLLATQASEEQLRHCFGKKEELSDDSVIHRFLTVRHQYPDKIAVSDGAQQLTYAELEQRARVLAVRLTAGYEGSHSPIAIYCNKTIELSIALVASALCQRPYLLLNPYFPDTLLNNMIVQSHCKQVLTVSSLKSVITAVQPIVIEEELLNPSRHSERSEGSSAVGAMLQDGRSLATTKLYKNYTSGSTSNPKAVFVSIYNFANVLTAMNEHLHCTARDVLLSFTAVSFDIFNLEFWLPLTTGGQLVLCDLSTRVDEQRLKHYLHTFKPSLIQATPTLWAQLIELSAFDWPVQMITGGERLPHYLKEQLLNKAKAVFNAYGPTETTVWSSIAVVQHDVAVTIGRPLLNTDIFILDEAGQLVPDFVPGELYIAGAGVVDGYVDNDSETAQRFIQRSIQGRLYSLFKTGDYAYWDNDHQLHFLYRKDNQLKIRGYRVDLNHIEDCLALHPAVDQCWVIAQGSEQLLQLIAFVTLAQAKPQSHSVQDNLITMSPANTDDLVVKPKMEFSLFFFSSELIDNYDLYLDAVRYADKNGFTAVWTPERHFDAVGGNYPNPALLSAALATITDSIQLRAGSVVLPLHHPATVVEDWAVVDKLSKGRIGLSFAPGWHSRDFILNPEHYASRKQVLIENIAIFKALWQGQAHEFSDGTHTSIAVQTYPKPYTAVPPLWITAAGNIQTFIEAGQQGLNVLTHLLIQSQEELKANIAAYRQALQEHGFDPATKTVTLMIHTYIANDDEDAVAVTETALKNYLKAHLNLGQDQSHSLASQVERVDKELIIDRAFQRLISGNSLVGTVEACQSIAAHFHAIGVTELACLVDFGLDKHLVLEHLEHIKQLHRVPVKNDQSQELEQIKEYLRANLPLYMQPNDVVVLQAPPTTANGKLDMKKLQQQIKPRDERVEQSSEQPVALLKTLVQSIVHSPHLHDDSDFFQSGGNSIKAMQLVAQVNQAFSVELTINDVFFYTTIRTLAQCIEQKLQVTYSPIPHYDERDEVPLSFLQQRMLFSAEIKGMKELLVIPTLIEFKGDFNKTALLESIKAILSRHSILRATLINVDGRMMQRALPSSQILIQELTLPETQLMTVVHSIIEHVDFSEGQPLISFTVMNMEDEKHVALLMIQSHLISENAGKSGEIFARELMAGYLARVDGTAPVVPALLHSYFDYARWVQQYDKPAVDAPLQQWIERLASAVPSKIAADHQGAGHRGARYVLWLDSNMSEAIAAACLSAQVTEYMYLLSFYSLLVSHLTQSSQTIIGSPFANRAHPDVQDLLGFFVNTVPMMIDFSGDLSVDSLLKQTRELCLHAHQYQHLNINYLMEQLEPSKAHRPLFHLLFTYQNAQEANQLRLPGVEIEVTSPYLNVAEFDISLIIYPVEGALKCVFEYNSALYHEERIQRMADYYQRLLQASLVSKHSLLSKLQYLPQDFIKKALTITPVCYSEITPALEEKPHSYSYPQDDSIVSLLTRAATIVPEHIALIDGEEQWTYGQIDALSNGLAQQITETFGRQSSIFLYAKPSAAAVISVFAILKSGAAYVALHARQSAEHLRAIIDDVGHSCVLIDEELSREGVLPAQCRLLNIDTALAAIVTNNTMPVAPEVKAKDTAYIIYTSGTTGIPKGVAVRHEQVISLLYSCRRLFDFKHDDVWTLFHDFSFDFSVWEVFGAVFNCATLLVVPQQARENAEQFHQLISQNSATVLSQTPSSFYRLMLADQHSYSRLSPLRYLVLGGERFVPKHYHAWFSKYGFEAPQVVNMYGITEITVHATYKTISLADLADERSPIGGFLDGISGVVLNDKYELLPPGIPGELYVQGERVVDGYNNRPLETKHSFLDLNHYGHSRRFYKTGDRVLCDAQQQFYYLGRADSQIKIRGYRVELQAIESALLSLVWISAAKLLYEDDILIAFVCLKAPLQDVESVTKEALKMQLAAYELPDKILVVGEMPINDNFKIDTKALLRHYKKHSSPHAKDIIEEERSLAALGMTERSTQDLEQQFLAIIRTELSNQDVDCESNLFECGLNSLKASLISYKVKKELHINLSIEVLFSTPQVGSLLATLKTLSTLKNPTLIQF